MDMVSIHKLIKFIQSLSVTERQFLSEIMLTKIMLLVPAATNAINERSFSALRRLKTYLRSTISDQRLNFLMILPVHWD